MVNKAAILEPFMGTWKADRSENFDEYLKSLGCNIAKRMIATRCPVTWIFSYNPETEEISSTMKALRTVTTIFKLDESFEGTSPEGEPTRAFSTIDEEGRWFVEQHGTWEDEKHIVFLREIIGGEMHQTSINKRKNVSFVRVFKKVS